MKIHTGPDVRQAFLEEEKHFRVKSAKHAQKSLQAKTRVGTTWHKNMSKQYKERSEDAGAAAWFNKRENIKAFVSSQPPVGNQKGFQKGYSASLKKK